MFLRWSVSTSGSGRLEDIAWAFEYNDRMGRFNCFYCGGVETQPNSRRYLWDEKCRTIPELVKAMSASAAERRAFDEVKVFETASADSGGALQMLVQRSNAREELAGRVDPLEEARELLTRYGVRGLIDPRGFSAPFLWYNMLPGKSVPLRKLAVHLFELRVESSAHAPGSLAELEDFARKVARHDPDVFSLGECFVARTGSGFVLGLAFSVKAELSIAQGRTIAQRIESTIRATIPKVRHVFLQLEPAKEVE